MRTKSFLVLVVSIIAITLVGISSSVFASSTNYLDNGQFDEDREFGDGYYSYWSPSEGGIDVSYDDTEYYAGSQSLKVEYNETGAVMFSQFNATDRGMDKNGSYLLSAMVKTDLILSDTEQNRDIGMFIKFKDDQFQDVAGAQVLDYSWEKTIENDEWSRIYLEFEISEDANPETEEQIDWDVLVIEFLAVNATGTVWFDDMILTDTPDNLMQPESFDESFDFGDETYSDWSPSEGGIDLSLDDTIQASGTNSLKIEYNEIGAVMFSQFNVNDRDMAKTGDYLLSFKYQSDLTVDDTEDSRGVGMIIKYKNDTYGDVAGAENFDLTWTHSFSDTVTEWTDHTVQFTINEDANQSTEDILDWDVLAIEFNAINATGTLWLDDVRLIRLDADQEAVEIDLDNYQDSFIDGGSIPTDEADLSDAWDIDTNEDITQGISTDFGGYLDPEGASYYLDRAAFSDGDYTYLYQDIAVADLAPNYNHVLRAYIDTLRINSDDNDALPYGVYLHVEYYDDSDQLLGSESSDPFTSGNQAFTLNELTFDSGAYPDATTVRAGVMFNSSRGEVLIDDVSLVAEGVIPPDFVPRDDDMMTLGNLPNDLEIVKLLYGFFAHEPLPSDFDGEYVAIDPDVTPNASGGASLRIDRSQGVGDDNTYPDEDAFFYQVFNDLDKFANETYTFSVFVKTEDLVAHQDDWPAGVYGYIQFKNAAGTVMAEELASNIQLRSGDSDWTELTIEFNPHDYIDLGAESMSTGVRMLGLDDGTIWINHLSLTREDVTAPDYTGDYNEDLSRWASDDDDEPADDDDDDTTDEPTDDDDDNTTDEPTDNDEEDTTDEEGSNLTVIIASIISVLAVGTGAIVFFSLKRK